MNQYALYYNGQRDMLAPLLTCKDFMQARYYFKRHLVMIGELASVADPAPAAYSIGFASGYETRNINDIQHYAI